MVYNGQEVGASLRPDLFEKDDINWDTGVDLSPLMSRLHEIRQDALFTHSVFSVKHVGNGVIFAEHKMCGHRIVGYFCTGGRSTIVRSDIPEGRYTNLIDGRELRVTNSVIALYGEPVIIKMAESGADGTDNQYDSIF